MRRQYSFFVTGPARYIRIRSRPRLNLKAEFPDPAKFGDNVQLGKEKVL